MSTPPGPQDPYGQQPGYTRPPPAGSYGAAPQGSPPPNYLVWAIISVFLCWPLAIPAIVFASQVNTKWSQGDVAGAHEASGKAKKFALWATILFAVLLVLDIGLVVIGNVLSNA